MTGSIARRRARAWVSMCIAMSMAATALAAPDQEKTWSGKQAPLATPSCGSPNQPLISAGVINRPSAVEIIRV